MNTNELAKAINPKSKPSYSPNLHKWVSHWAKGHPDYLVPQVYRDLESGNMLRIGYQSREATEPHTCGFVGVRLGAVLCHGSAANKERGWFTTLGPGNMVHIADFWDRYFEIGRCAIDTSHTKSFIGSEGRYLLSAELRSCTWCGAQHRRRIEIKTVKVERFDAIDAESMT